MKNKYFLKTSYPCLIKTTTTCMEIDVNDIVEIEDERFLFVYPSHSKEIPFYINLDYPQENSRFSIINKDEKQILFLENEKNIKLFQKENLNFSGTLCEITISENVLSFESNNKKICYQCPHTCQNYRVFKIKNFACVQFDNDLYIYSIHKNKLSHFGGDQIEIDKDTISTHKKFHDSENREKFSKYKLGEDISIESEEFLNRKSPFPKELVSFKMLESVKAKDYQNSVSYLTDNLKEKIDVPQIKEFFGEISAFLPITENEFITISNFHKNYVKFILSNGKIDDILIDQL